MNKNKTPMELIICFGQELNYLALSGSIDVDIVFGHRKQKKSVPAPHSGGFDMQVIFFDENKNNFTMYFYQFRSEEKNRKLLEKAKELIRDCSLFEEVRDGNVRR